MEALAQNDRSPKLTGYQGDLPRLIKKSKPGARITSLVALAYGE
jgi:hypothetical protein